MTAFNPYIMRYNYDAHRRIIGNYEVAIHCHHYSARLQRTLENSKQVQGRKFFLQAAEFVFANYLPHFFSPQDTTAHKWKIVESLYSHLGYGKLQLDNIEHGFVTASASLFVEGWQAGFGDRTEPMCLFTQGFLQGAIYAVTGQATYVCEENCRVMGDLHCLFRINPQRTKPIAHYHKKVVPFELRSRPHAISSNIDEEHTVHGFATLPIYGNEAGLIPAFGVYLSHTPVDFFNLVSILFVEEMQQKNLFNVAKRLLIDTAENCAVNTFGGFMNSQEWQQLIAPQLKEPLDRLFGIVALINALGWGHLRVKELIPGEKLMLESFNGYEALGFKAFRDHSPQPQCFMMVGVAAGIMELLYSEGTYQEKFGTFIARETQCIACGAESCIFEVERL